MKNRPFVSSATPAANPWRIRAVQLDLARQIESLDAIRQFIHFAREWGYNTLMLYVEGVIRTRIFPYRSPRASYSPDQIRRIVEMADDAGLDVIPGMATLGHVEHFLACKELKHLGEPDARWCDNMFCPSNERVYDFLERYLGEIARLFPSKHFHIGCDESWALGNCPTCRQRMKNGEKIEDLHAGHVRRVHEILRSFRKRVWIWDDMYENDMERLKTLPRDIVMCAWHYGADLMDYDGFQGHFNNLHRTDFLSLYEKLGFEVVVCPWAKGIEGVLGITEVARQHQVLGGLQTIWELSGSFLPGTLPGVALAGAMWSAPRRCPKELLDETFERLFPGVSPEGILALRGAVSDPYWATHSIEYFLRGNLTMEEIRNLNSFVMYEQIIRQELTRLREGLERDIVREVHTNLRLQILAGRQRKLLPKLIDPRIKVIDRPMIREALGRCVNEFGELAQQRKQDWRKYRAGVQPDHASRHLLNVKGRLQAFIRKAVATPARQRAMLKVQLFLWDSFSAPRLRLELGVGDRWRKVYRGCFKPVNHRDALYTLQVPLAWKGPDPDRLRITVSGFGGQGVSYASLFFENRTLLPHGISAVSGEVTNATAILTNNTSLCLLGSPDTPRTLQLQAENEESTVEVLLKKA